MARDLDVVRHELCSRIAVLDRRAPSARPVEIAAVLDEIRAIATSAGFAPLLTVLPFLTSALARGERGAGVQPWLAMLTDAAGCERHDAAACDTFAAACSVRLAA